MCCSTCVTLPQYAPVQSRETLNYYEHLASSHVEQGVLDLCQVPDPNSDFKEHRYICKHCGTSFVLWLDTYLVKSGGEWRMLNI